MSRLTWFRMYHEARTDNKLRILTDAQHRVWFNLMCLASEQDERGVIDGYDDDLLAIEVASGDSDLVRATLAVLCRLRIVTVEDGAISFVNFTRRQQERSDTPSDSPERVKERVDRYRGRGGNGVTASSNGGNDQIREEEKRVEESRGETPPSTGGELVLIHPPMAGQAYSPEFEAFWLDFPRKVEKKAAWRAWNTRRRAGTPAEDMIAASHHYAIAKRDAEQRYIKHAATFLGPDEPFREFVAGVPDGERAGGKVAQSLNGIFAAGSRMGFEEGA